MKVSTARELNDVSAMNASSVERFVSQPALALVGVSRSKRKFGNAAFRELGRRGYRVYAVHPLAEQIEGIPCYRRFVDLPEPVGALVVVVPPVQAIDVVRDAAAAGIKQIWLQQGAESPRAVEFCREKGIDVIAGECVLMYAHPGGIHKVHRWLRSFRRSFGTDNRRHDGGA